MNLSEPDREGTAARGQRTPPGLPRLKGWVRAAVIGLLAALPGMWAAQGREPLQMGTGLNTGEVIVGNIGAEARKVDCTVIGDHVNLAARVESLNKRYWSHILITEFTLERVRRLIASGKFGHLTIQGTDRVAVKGKEKPVQVFRLKPEEPGSRTTLSERAGTVVSVAEDEADPSGETAWHLTWRAVEAIFTRGLSSRLQRGWRPLREGGDGSTDVSSCVLCPLARVRACRVLFRNFNGAAPHRGFRRGRGKRASHGNPADQDDRRAHRRDLRAAGVRERPQGQA